MSTRPAPRGSGSVEIATQNDIFPGSVGLAQAQPLMLTTKTPAMGDGLPPDLVQLRSTLLFSRMGANIYFCRRGKNQLLLVICGELQGENLCLFFLVVFYW